MKIRTFITTILIAVIAIGCQKDDYQWIKTGIERAQHQLMLTAAEIDGTGKLPRSIWVGYDFAKLQEQLEKEIFVDSLRPQPAAEKLGRRRVCDIYDWTSGFFPGSLWYVYEFTGDELWSGDSLFSGRSHRRDPFGYAMAVVSTACYGRCTAIGL